MAAPSHLTAPDQSTPSLTLRGRTVLAFRAFARLFQRRSDAKELHWHTRALRLVGPVVMLCCLGVLAGQTSADVIRQAAQVLAQVPVWMWAGALLLAAGSLVAIARGEAAVHDILQTGIPHPTARRAAWQAIAISQVTGFAPLVSGLVRRQVLEQADFWSIARITLCASIGFMGVLGIWTAIAVMVHVTGGDWLILSTALLGVLSLRRMRPSRRLPGLNSWNALRLWAWMSIDILLAGIIFAMFLGPATGLSLSTLLAVYAVGLGVGLLSQSPGGLGAFELTVLTLLPDSTAPAALAAMLAYRVCYLMIPAAVAVCALIIRSPKPRHWTLQKASGPALQRALHRSAQAEWGLAHQCAEVWLTPDQSTGILCRTAGPAFVSIGCPLGGAATEALTRAAQDQSRFPMFYKCDARTAAQARAQGWTVSLISQEAVLNPPAWSLDGPDKRQLRRKLKSATKGGLRIDCAPRDVPWAQMELVHHHWCATHGGERGFSMGQYDRALAEKQVIILGYLEARLVGFVTFHTGRSEWTLDLVRYVDAAPSGTMQSLIAAAIAQARLAQVDRLSLAACLHHRRPFAKWIGGAEGVQFKSSFSPKWEPLYMATPNRAQHVLGALCVAAKIRFPGEVTTITPTLKAQPPKFTIETAFTPCNSPAQQPSVRRTHNRSLPHDQRPDTAT